MLVTWRQCDILRKIRIFIVIRHSIVPCGTETTISRLLKVLDMLFNLSGKREVLNILILILHLFPLKYHRIRPNLQHLLRFLILQLLD